MANSEVSPVETKKDVEPEVQSESRDVQENDPEDSVQATAEEAGSHEASATKATDLKQDEEARKDVERMLDATKLMEKLDVGESRDDPSSSLDSTANSGACYVAQDDSNNVVSSEESSEGGAQRPKKRIDLQHQIVREIVKIQHERDEYEKQCKEQEKGGKQATSSVSGTTKPEVVGTQANPERQRTGGEDVQVEKSTRGSSFYRPPNLRNDQGASRLPQGLKITLDLQKQKRSIQVGSPPVVSKSETNFTVTYDAAKKERHVQVERTDEDTPDKIKSPKGDASSPSHFEFKATTQMEKSVSSKRTMRGNGNFKASGVLGSTTGRENGSVTLIPKRLEEVVVPPLPPKDKPFAAELRWSDMVESEDESPVSKADNPSSSTPDVSESNRRKNSNRRRRHNRNERTEQREENPSQPDEAPKTANTERRSVFDRLEDKRHQRRSVFERLGARIDPPQAPPSARLRTVHYEAAEARQHHFRGVSEREYLYENESRVTGGTQPRDGRQKRSGFELYVPRRGG